ncbi:hypothetical protein TI03_02735 [Achromatium sp. WMS1]|nr:hypothetical protein TI03_02735 [Achromatium sp. WMS1]
MRVSTGALFQQIKAHPYFVREDHNLGFEVRLFNTSLLAARQLLLNYPLCRYADLRGQERIHVVILGFTDTAEHVVLQLAKHGHYRDFDVPMVTVLTPNAQQIQNELFNRYPALNGNDPNHPYPFCQVNFICCNPLQDPFNQQYPDGSYGKPESRLEHLELLGCAQEKEKQNARAEMRRGSVTAVLVFGKNDHESMIMALRFQNQATRARLALAPIFICLQDNKLPDLMQPVAATAYMASVLQPFGTIPNVCCQQEIVNSLSDRLPAFFHETYRAKWHPHGGNAPNQQPWEHLIESMRDSNRSQADHVLTKLEASGYWTQRNVTCWGVGVCLFGEYKDILARNEHQRWVAERMLNGWEYSAIRDDSRKLHPDLLSWEQLPDNIRKLDYSHLEDLDTYFATEHLDSLNEVTKRLKVELLKTTPADNVVRHLQVAGLIVNTSKVKPETIQIAIAAIMNHLAPIREQHIRLCCSLQNAAEVMLVAGLLEQLQTKKYSHHLLVPEGLPVLGTASAPWQQQRQVLCAQAEWVIDLLPPGIAAKELVELDTKTQQRQILQQERTWAYIVERSDWLFVGGQAMETETIRNWRSGRTAIAAEYSSIPASLKNQRTHSTTGAWWQPDSKQLQPL